MSGKGLFRCLSIAAALLVAATANQVYAQRGGMMGAQGVNPLQLVSLEPVQKELGLSSEKQDKLKDIGNDVREEMTQERAGAGIDFSGLQDLSREERQKRMAEIGVKMAEITKKINAKFLPKVKEVLDEKQMARLHEIAVQAAGWSAFQDADVAKELALTKEQQDKIKKIGDEYSEKTRALFTSGGDQAEMRTKMAELRKEQNEKAAEVLTKDQSEKFEKMKGKPFDVAQLRPRRRPQ